MKNLASLLSGIGVKDLVSLFSALLTPAIAIVTTTIVILQYRTERQKWRLALFDKRYPVFLSAMGFIASIVAQGDAKDEDLTKFLRDSKDRDLLFGDEVKEHLELLHRKGVDLRTHSKIMERLPIGEERTKHTTAIRDLNLWFESQYKATRQVFYPYIKIAET
jgi:hypothetical protein